ncbi:MAG: glycosyl transferase group 1 [Gammaproteobacteria bacterium]|nr:glycosyl transferase group 1 [Gammaproteobacteria bacterium]
MSRLARLGIVRLEEHTCDGGYLTAQSSFPNWLRAVSLQADGLGLILPIDPSTMKSDDGGTSRYRLRDTDRLFALGNYRGLVRALIKLPHLMIQLVKLRRFTDTVLVRAPEHGNFILPALVWALRFKAVLWFVSDRGEVESAMVARRRRSAHREAAVMFSRLTGWLEGRWALRYPVIANGSALGAQLTAGGVPQVRLLTVISTTFPQADIEPAAPEWRRGAGEPLKILYVGRIALEKGLGDLIDAVRLLPASVTSEMRISLIGWASHGEQERLVEHIRASGLQEQVELVGPIPFGPALLRHYRAAHLFVLPSWTEGTPRVLVEAMAMGRPIVATRVGGVPDLITEGENGLLVDPHSPSQLAAAIQTLAGDPELCRCIGRRNWQMAASLTAEALTERMCGFIERSTRH